MSLLYDAPFFPQAALLVVCLAIALELGHRLGRIAPVAEQQASTVATSTLAVIGLVLAFSFSMAAERHALRKAAAVQEANSIGTFWLRTSLLPEPTRSAMRSRVRRYVDLHFEHRLAGVHEAKLGELEAEAERIQQELWTLLIEDARRDPEAARLRLVTPALNAVMDDAASILAAKENRLPDAIYLYLFVLVIIGGVVIGYRPPGEGRSPILWAMFVAVVSGVLLILIDLDRPRGGLIQTDPAPFVRLRQSMQWDPP